ncbi:hypothetical protein SEA_ABIGAIL_60 [Microbacterium phage Abigail]|uniref:hypothetical protein n=1 Tax=Microbacterium phage Abigail TaxID=2851101 RepID=UPI001C77C0FC|nr:hypothetical protein QDW37_gp60 [Microbacterium phage Abigail]QXN73560.1 hypothetical protein SEA_ABIGAIL_60 [Microbacterium phage Abigail]
MPNEVPTPEEPKPIEHYIGAAIMTVLGTMNELAPVLSVLPPALQNETIVDLARRTAAVAGETIRAHHADGKIDI